MIEQMAERAMAIVPPLNRRFIRPRHPVGRQQRVAPANFEPLGVLLSVHPGAVQRANPAHHSR